MYKGRVAGGRARVWGHLEGGVPIELKDAEVDVVTGEAALEQLQTDPDALVLLPVRVRRRPSRHHPRPIRHQHLRNMVERSQQKCNNSHLQRFYPIPVNLLLSLGYESQYESHPCITM